MRGELIWADFSDSRRHEQRNEGDRPRPYLIVSEDAVYMRSGLVVACPLTSNLAAGPNQMTPYRVRIEPSMVQTASGQKGLDKPGLVLCEQVRVMDPEKRAKQARGERFLKIGRLHGDAMFDVESVLRLG